MGRSRGEPDPLAGSTHDRPRAPRLCGLRGERGPAFLAVLPRTVGTRKRRKPTSRREDVTAHDRGNLPSTYESLPWQRNGDNRRKFPENPDRRRNPPASKPLIRTRLARLLSHARVSCRPRSLAFWLKSASARRSHRPTRPNRVLDASVCRTDARKRKERRLAEPHSSRGKASVSADPSAVELSPENESVAI